MHPNEKLLHDGYAAFKAGDIPAVLAIFDPDIVWTATGHNSLAGQYKGHDQVVGFFQKLVELTAGSFALEMTRIIADDHGAVALVAASGTRDGQRYAWNYAHVWEMHDGRATTFTEYADDGRAQDALFA